MTSDNLTAYLMGEIQSHVQRFFVDEVTESLKECEIKFLPYQVAVNSRTAQIVIPVDIDNPTKPELMPAIPFGTSEIKLFNPIPRPDGDEWQVWPDESKPIWYRHRSGAIMPTWNLYKNLIDLLTHQEERDSNLRDSHARCLGVDTARNKAGLLEQPHFNDSVALLVGATYWLAGDESKTAELDGLVRPPVIVLSHDCDVLLGNDFWTQAVRGYRIVAPMKKLRFPAISNFWWLLRNACTPQSYYFDNLIGMIELERIYGYHSTFYLINGSRGRFGARSGEAELRQVINSIDPPWEIGIHYNYDTHLNISGLCEQYNDLQALIPNVIDSGRAHYLRFEPMQSYQLWDEIGIKFDESVGYSDRIGYRCGIAGCFHPLDPVKGCAMNLVELPVVVMDKVLVDQYAAGAALAFGRLMDHLKNVGGATTVIFHPGQFFNPEHKQMLGVYNQLLSECHRVGAVSETAKTLAGRTAQ